MLYWIIFSIFILILLWCSILCKNTACYTNKVAYLFITLVSGFRYMIGGDYSEYINMYYDADILVLKAYPEISFTIISVLLKYFGLSYQCLFLVYTLIISIFFYKGLTYYIKNPQIIGIAIGLYYSSLFVGYWESMNTIRQMAAVMVCFYGTRFLLKKNLKKYFLWVIVAIFLHYSAIISLLAPIMTRLQLSKKVCFGIMSVSIISIKFHFVDIFYYFFSLTGRGLSYIGKLNEFPGTNLGFILLLFIYLFCLLLYQNNDNIQRINFTLYTWGIIFYILFLPTAHLSRFSFFFLIHMYVTIAYVLYYKISPRLFILGVLLLSNILFLFKLSTIPNNENLINNVRESANNIEYQINIKLFDS